MMNILFFGDIVGKRGREVVRDFLPVLKEKYQPDLIIMNAENSAHGKGITYKIYNELLAYGADFLTMGNHTFSKKEILEHLNECDRLICPGNFIGQNGKCIRFIKVKGLKIGVINLLGQAQMGDYCSNPFLAMNEILKLCKVEEPDILFVDFHAEATAEKRLFAEAYKDRVQVVVGTHTHIQTADECILDGKTAFISDVGMCGVYNSIIGRDIDECIRSRIYGEKTRYTIADGPAILCGVIISIDEETKLPTGIERIQIRPEIKRR